MNWWNIIIHALQFDAVVILFLVGALLYAAYPSLRPVLPTRIFYLVVFTTGVITLTLWIMTGSFTARIS